MLDRRCLGEVNAARTRWTTNGFELLRKALLYATAGYKPWELAWLFQDFQNADGGEVPQLLSDHPAINNASTHEKHLRANPSVFGKFNSDPKSARPITVPKDAAELFLH